MSFDKASFDYDKARETVERYGRAIDAFNKRFDTNEDINNWLVNTWDTGSRLGYRTTDGREDLERGIPNGVFFRLLRRPHDRRDEG